MTVLARMTIFILWCVVFGALGARFVTNTPVPAFVSFCVWLAASIMLVELILTMRSGRR